MREEKAFVAGMTEEELNAFFSVTPGPSKSRLFTERKFTVTGHKLSGETFVISNVGRTVANREKLALRKKGCYRVDIIETETTVNETVSGTKVARQMVFAQQAFAAANEKLQPEQIEEPKQDAQKTFAWDILSETEPAWLDNRPKVKVSDRNAKVRAERKRSEIFSRLNAKAAEIESMKIFDYATGNFLFSSKEENAIVNYMREHKLSAKDVVIYVPTETYWMLKGTEK